MTPKRNGRWRPLTDRMLWQLELALAVSRTERTSSGYGTVEVLVRLREARQPVAQALASELQPSLGPHDSKALVTRLITGARKADDVDLTVDEHARAARLLGAAGAEERRHEDALLSSLARKVVDLMRRNRDRVWTTQQVANTLRERHDGVQDALRTLADCRLVIAQAHPARYRLPDPDRVPR
jgi:hypothetical protein